VTGVQTCALPISGCIPFFLRCAAGWNLSSLHSFEHQKHPMLTG